ncbi:hypothetical protein P7K49_002128, partial [Saguinus oedipus]
ELAGDRQVRPPRQGPRPATLASWEPVPPGLGSRLSSRRSPRGAREGKRGSRRTRRRYPRGPNWRDPLGAAPHQRLIFQPKAESGLSTHAVSARTNRSPLRFLWARWLAAASVRQVRSGAGRYLANGARYGFLWLAPLSVHQRSGGDGGGGGAGLRFRGARRPLGEASAGSGAGLGAGAGAGTAASQEDPGPERERGGGIGSATGAGPARGDFSELLGRKPSLSGSGAGKFANARGRLRSSAGHGQGSRAGSRVPAAPEAGGRPTRPGPAPPPRPVAPSALRCGPLKSPMPRAPTRLRGAGRGASDRRGCPRPTVLVGENPWG